MILFKMSPYGTPVIQSVSVWYLHKIYMRCIYESRKTM